MGRANRARVVSGLNLEKRGSAWLRFLFRANAFRGQNTEHARLKEVDAVWFGFIKGERTGDRGEANDKLGGWLSPCTFNRNVLVLTSSPEWVSKLPGMLGPL